MYGYNTPDTSISKCKISSEVSCGLEKIGVWVDNYFKQLSTIQGNIERLGMEGEVETLVTGVKV